MKENFLKKINILLFIIQIILLLFFYSNIGSLGSSLSDMQETFENEKNKFKKSDIINKLDYGSSTRYHFDFNINFIYIYYFIFLYY